MSESFQTLGIPASSSTVTVKAFNLVNDPSKVSISASLFLTPVLPGHESLRCPAFAFLIENAATKRRVMFDLGPRKDLENAAPSLAEAFKAGALDMPMKRDIVEQLTDNGVDLKSISAVIWSHSHFDHTGDMSKFPSSTELVFGQEMVRATYVTDPSSTLLESDLAGRNLVAVDFASSQLEFAGFKVHDFFGDGSLYLLDVPGHLPGHLCALARVTPTSFLFLGGDACHHAGLFRPTDKLHKHFPCPGDLLAATRRSVSAAHFSPPGAAAGSEFDLTARTTPLLDVADNGYYTDPPTARTSIGKMGSFDANKDVFVMLAHDESLMSVVGPFPALLDAWQAKGWKELVTWAFLDEKNPAFRFNTKAKA
ncbi:beta-lactamase-like protein [Mycena rosella]|uniref:Beta-lactamase-like protein n=1 Tax=Mycena rosella TaxID=1033263 RepID=A0AAD7C389_MYCRO|nr:beta-lactamase-like protein [Mycena rosella]